MARLPSAIPITKKPIFQSATLPSMPPPAPPNRTKSVPLTPVSSAASTVSSSASHPTPSPPLPSSSTLSTTSSSGDHPSSFGASTREKKGLKTKKASWDDQYLEALGRSMAPEIRFHPKEEFFPCRVEWVLQWCQLNYEAKAVQKIKADDIVLHPPGIAVHALTSQKIFGDSSAIDRTLYENAATNSSSSAFSASSSFSSLPPPSVVAAASANAMGKPKELPPFSSFYYLKYTDRKGRSGEKHELPRVPVYLDIIQHDDLGQCEFRYWFLFACKPRRSIFGSSDSEGAHWQFLSVYVQMGSRFGARILRIFLPSSDETGEKWWYIQNEPALGYQLTADNHPIVYCSPKNHAFYPRAGSFSRSLISSDSTEDGGLVWQTWKSDILRIPHLAQLKTFSRLEHLLYSGRWSPDPESCGPLLAKVTRAGLPALTPANTQPPDPDDHACSGLTIDQVRRIRVSNLLGSAFYSQRWIQISTPVSFHQIVVGHHLIDDEKTVPLSSHSTSSSYSTSSSHSTLSSHSTTQSHSTTSPHSPSTPATSSSTTNQNPSKMKDLVWGIDGQGQLYLYDEVTEEWISLPCRLKELSCGRDGTTWAINHANKVFRLPRSQLQKMLELLPSHQSSIQTPLSPTQTPRQHSTSQQSSSQKNPQPHNQPQQQQQVSTNSSSTPSHQHEEDDAESEPSFEPYSSASDLESDFLDDEESDSDRGERERAETVSASAEDSQATVEMAESSELSSSMPGQPPALASCNNSLPGWEFIPHIELRTVAVSESNSIWGITTYDEIVQIDSSLSWTAIARPADLPEGAKIEQISVGIGAVWIRASSGHVYRYLGSKWVSVPGRLSFLFVGSFTKVWGVEWGTRALVRWSGSSFEASGELSDYVTGNAEEGDLWSVCRLPDDRSAVTRLISHRLSLMPVQEFQKLWDDVPKPGGGLGGSSSSSSSSSSSGGSGAAGAQHHISFFRPIPPTGYHIVGDYVEHSALSEAQGFALAVCESSTTRHPWPPLLAAPVGFEVVWSTEAASRYGTLCIWKPIPPDGYAALGCVTTPSPMLRPSLQTVRCVNLGLLVEAQIRYSPRRRPFWSSGPLSIWPIAQLAEGILPGTFIATTTDPAANKAILSSFFAFSLQEC